MRHPRLHRLALLAGVLALIPAAAACVDTCSGIDCGPAPPVLRVVVLDTATRTGTIDGHDTSWIITDTTSAATVIAFRTDATDTTAIDTLRPLDDAFVADDTTRYEGITVAVVAFRTVTDTLGNPAFRAAARYDLTLKRVGGCCPFPIVGDLVLRLPPAPVTARSTSSRSQ